MERNMDLIRLILLEMEKRLHQDRGKPIELDGFSPEEVSYHVKLLDQAGFIEATIKETRETLYAVPLSLTWTGHEFLDAAREPSRWNKAKAIITDKAGSVSFETLKALLVSLALHAVGLKQ